MRPALHNHMLNTTTINCVLYSACLLMERPSLTQHHWQSMSVLLCISPLGVEGGSAMVLENIWTGIKVWTQNKHKSKTQNKHESNQGGGWIGWCWNTYWVQRVWGEITPNKEVYCCAKRLTTQSTTPTNYQPRRGVLVKELKEEKKTVWGWGRLSGDMNSCYALAWGLTQNIKHCQKCLFKTFKNRSLPFCGVNFRAPPAMLSAPLFTSSIIGCMEILFLILAASHFGLDTQYVIVHIKIGWRKHASLAKQMVWPSNFAQFAEAVHLLEKSVTNMIWLPLIYDWLSRWFGIRSLPSIWDHSFSFMDVS